MAGSTSDTGGRSRGRPCSQAVARTSRSRQPGRAHRHRPADAWARASANHTRSTTPMKTPLRRLRPEPMRYVSCGLWVGALHYTASARTSDAIPVIPAQRGDRGFTVIGPAAISSPAQECVDRVHRSPPRTSCSNTDVTTARTMASARPHPGQIVSTKKPSPPHSRPCRWHVRQQDGCQWGGEPRDRGCHSATSAHADAFNGAGNPSPAGTTISTRHPSSVQSSPCWVSASACRKSPADKRWSAE